MSNKNLKYIPFIIIASLILIYVSRSMSNTILLFPFWLNALLFLIALPIAWFFCNKWNIFSSENEAHRKSGIFFNGIVAVLLAFVLLCAIRLPINIFIKQQAKKNELVTQTCPITFYSIGLKKQQKKHITFTFNNKSIRMKIKSSEMQQLKNSTNSEKNIQLQLRKSILGTYVVEDYKI